MTTTSKLSAFSDEELMEKLKTFEQVCEHAGEDPAKYALPEGLSEQEMADEIGVNAFRKLQLIYRVFNKGKKLPYGGSSSYKYYPWFAWAGSGFSYYDCDYFWTGTGVGARLSTDTTEKAKYIGTQFLDIYNTYLSN